jgi:steroid delta-isomerase
MPERDDIERAVRRYAAAWAARDREAWLATFAEHATQEDPVGDGVRRGREEIGRFWDRAMAAYPSLQIVPRDIFVNGREAAMEWSIHATNAEGSIVFDGVDILVFDETAHIVSARAFWERERIRRSSDGPACK